MLNTCESAKVEPWRIKGLLYSTNLSVNTYRHMEIVLRPKRLFHAHLHCGFVFTSAVSADKQTHRELGTNCADFVTLINFWTCLDIAMSNFNKKESSMRYLWFSLLWCPGFFIFPALHLSHFPVQRGQQGPKKATLYNRTVIKALSGNDTGNRNKMNVENRSWSRWGNMTRRFKNKNIFPNTSLSKIKTKGIAFAEGLLITRHRFIFIFFTKV